MKKKNVLTSILCLMFISFGTLLACSNNGGGSNNSNESNQKEYCEVTFKNYDASILYYNTVKYGEDATYVGETPSRPSSVNYDYIFIGWDKPLEHITCDTIFIAQYEQVTPYYTVNYYNGNDLLYSEEVLRGTASIYTEETPTKEYDDRNIYTFVGWDKDTSCVNEDMNVYAIFEESPNIAYITLSLTKEVKVLQGFDPEVHSIDSGYFDINLSDITLNVTYLKYNEVSNYFVECYDNVEVSYKLPSTVNNDIGDCLVGCVCYRGFEVAFTLKVCVNPDSLTKIAELSPTSIESSLLVDPFYNHVDSITLFEQNFCMINSDRFNIYAYEQDTFPGGNLRIYYSDGASCPENIDFIYYIDESNHISYKDIEFSSSKEYIYPSGVYNDQPQMYIPFTFIIDLNENNGYGILFISNNDIGNTRAIIRYDIKDNHLNIYCGFFDKGFDIVEDLYLVDPIN